MATTVQDVFQAGVAANNCMFRNIVYFTRPSTIVTLQEFTATHVTTSPAIAAVGGRPAVSLAGGGASTDGSNYQHGVAGFRFVAGKQTRIFGSTYLGDATNHAFFLGLAVVSTSLTANLDGGTPGTDYFGLHKKATVASIQLRSRKASGTEESTTLQLTLTDAQWLDWEIVVLPSSTAGAATVTVYCRQNLGAWAPILATQLGSQLPDTVSTALGAGFRAGSSNTTAFGLGHLGYEREF